LNITEILKTNKSALCDKLKKDEIRYIRENWIPKKAKIIRYYTKLYINLSIYSISRTEGLYPVLKEELFFFISLSLTIKRVAKTVIRVIKEFVKTEQKRLIIRLKTRDIKAF
jgi:hypothetical protein